MTPEQAELIGENEELDLRQIVSDRSIALNLDEIQ